MNISIKETIEIDGLCPVLNEQIAIDVTYKQLTVLGDPNTYAIVCNVDCPNIEECQIAEECPVAHQRTYW